MPTIIIYLLRLFRASPPPPLGTAWIGFCRFPASFDNFHKVSRFIFCYTLVLATRATSIKRGPVQGTLPTPPITLDNPKFFKKSNNTATFSSSFLIGQLSHDVTLGVAQTVAQHPATSNSNRRQSSSIWQLFSNTRQHSAAMLLNVAGKCCPCKLGLKGQFTRATPVAQRWATHGGSNPRQQPATCHSATKAGSSNRQQHWTT